MHGGCLLALVDAAAERLGIAAGPRRIEGRLTSSVPIETALDLVTERTAEATSFSIRQGGHTLTSGGVIALAEAPPVSSAGNNNVPRCERAKKYCGDTVVPAITTGWKLCAGAGATTPAT